MKPAGKLKGMAAIAAIATVSLCGKAAIVLEGDNSTALTGAPVATSPDTVTLLKDDGEPTSLVTIPAALSWSAVATEQKSQGLAVSPVPEPATLIAGALLLLPFAASTLRILRKGRTA